MTEDYPHLKKKIVENDKNIIRHRYDFHNGYSVVAEKDKRVIPTKPYSGLWNLSLYYNEEMLLTRDFPDPTAYYNDPTMDALLIRVARYNT